MPSIRKAVSRATQQVKQKTQQTVNKTKQTVNKAKQTVKENSKVVKGVTTAASQSARAIAFGKDAVEQIGRASKKLPVEGILGKKGLDFVRNPTFAAGKFTPLKKVMTQVKGATRFAGVASAASSVGTAARDIRNAVRSGSRDDITQAVRSSLDAGKSVVQVASGGIQGSKIAGGLLHGSVVAQKLKAEKAAFNAFKKVAPKVSDDVAKAASKAALKQVFEGGTKQVAKHAVTEAAQAAAKKVGGSVAKGVAGSGSRAAARAVLRTAGKESAEAALKAGARAAAGPMAKAAGRFAPGVNVAIAAIDVAQAGATLADRNASTGKKVTAVITAAGSVAAATNIPVVSQVGAAVSTVSSIVGAFF